MEAAAVAGLDPLDAEERTVGELTAFINAWHKRQKITAMMLYNHAAAIASMCFSKLPPKPWECFPGILEREIMTDEQLAGALDSWTDTINSSVEEDEPWTQDD